MNAAGTSVPKRPNHCPDNADDGLLVSDEDVAPGEKVEQLAIAPEITPVVAFGAAGLDDEVGEHGAGSEERGSQL